MPLIVGALIAMWLIGYWIGRATGSDLGRTQGFLACMDAWTRSIEDPSAPRPGQRPTVPQHCGVDALDVTAFDNSYRYWQCPTCGHRWDAERIARMDSVVEPPNAEAT